MPHRHGRSRPQRRSPAHRRRAGRSPRVDRVAARDGRVPRLPSAALHRAGFANQPTSSHVDDGLRWSDAFIVAPCRCAPPENWPEPEELRRCSVWLDGELGFLKKARVLLALGSVGWEAALGHFARRALVLPRPKPRFAHGAVLRLEGAPALLGSYHVSQQNTNTGKLTPAMLDEVLARAKELF
ncbi:MAG: uracil-DNA glycosylase [Deltaproteobacteria bacterium]|nr:MAG: uracil-DNA glycosylase [Deltaproteobacteria bacterium]